jgi:AcrR family transcriptional regulator
MTETARPYHSPLRARQAAGTREEILRALAAEFAEGGVRDFSVARVAERAGVSERTVYRHFPTRDALLEGLGQWVNAHLGDIPDDLAHARDLGPAMAAVFAGFDADEPMVRGLLNSPGGDELRAHARARRLERIDPVVRAALDGSPRADQVRALIFLLCSIRAWQSLRDDGGLDGRAAGEAVSWAIQTLLEAA